MGLATAILTKRNSLVISIAKKAAECQIFVNAAAPPVPTYRRA
jgi:hypothetical protein